MTFSVNLMTFCSFVTFSLKLYQLDASKSPFIITVAQ